jgi:hypothetical protein
MMESNDRYQSWKRRRAEIEVAADFADRVLAAVTEHEKKERQRFALRVWLAAVLFSRAGKVGLCSLAGLVCVLRVMHVVVVFLPQ